MMLISVVEFSLLLYIYSHLDLAPNYRLCTRIHAANGATLLLLLITQEPRAFARLETP